MYTVGGPTNMKHMEAAVCPVICKIHTHHQQNPSLKRLWSDVEGHQAVSAVNNCKAALRIQKLWSQSHDKLLASARRQRSNEVVETVHTFSAPSVWNRSLSDHQDEKHRLCVERKSYPHLQLTMTLKQRNVWTNMCYHLCPISCSSASWERPRNSTLWNHSKRIKKAQRQCHGWRGSWEQHHPLPVPTVLEAEGRTWAWHCLKFPRTIKLEAAGRRNSLDETDRQGFH